MILSKNGDLKNVGPTFFQDYPNVIRFNLVHLCPSTPLFPFAALQYVILSDFGGILCVMKVWYYIVWHIHFKTNMDIAFLKKRFTMLGP